MKQKALFVALLVSIFAFAVEEQARQEFLNLYFKGEYEKAHPLLNAAISDPLVRQIWESRIHLQQNLQDCNSFKEASPSVQAFAYLSIGQFEKAQKTFSDDWVSLWGEALFAQWNADVVTARTKIEQALLLQPENPELLFFAGEVAETPAKTIEFFMHFLNLNPDDPVKRSIAEYSIEFIKKTADMQLNVIRIEPGVQEIETDYLPSGIAIRAIVNSKEKLKLVVDSGAGSGLIVEKRDWTPQMVNDAVMLGLGKKQISKTKRIVLDTFQTGKFSIQNPLAAENETMPFHDVDGLIGSAIFGSHRLLLPVKSGKDLVLIPYELDPEEYFSSKRLKFNKKVTVPFFLVNKLIIVKGRIRKSPLDLDILIDTGAESSLISAAAAKKYASINFPLSIQMRRQTQLSGVGGKAENLLIAENVEVGVGELSRNFNNMLVFNFAESSDALGLEIDLLLGRNFLEGYTLLIDYRNRQLTFLK